MPRHLTLAELQCALPQITDSPPDNGVLRAIVIRPKTGMREELDAIDISRAGGVTGDNWAQACWKSTEDGRPHPDVQICIMNARSIELIAGTRDNWAPAGDNLFIDLDLSHDNLPAGQRLAIGTAIIEVTAEPHAGCTKFTRRYGRDATRFVNSSATRHIRLRGIYARVVKNGRVNVGDIVKKVSSP